MKKICIKVLALLLILSLAACSSNDDASSTSNDQTSSQEQQETVSSETTEETEEVNESKELTYGDTFTFDGFEITISNNIEWATVENQFAEENGMDVALVPVHIKNNSGETGMLNMFYYKFFGPSGVELSSLAGYFENTLDFSGELRDGAETDSYFALLYEGDGDYYIEFDNYSDKLEVKLPITK